jgi:hypothetical protein
MGWYDDEDKWPPDWAVKPIMWLGCLAVAVVPAGMALAALNLVWSRPPALVTLGAYLVALGLMLAAVRPWTVR